LLFFSTDKMVQDKKCRYTSSTKNMAGTLGPVVGCIL